MNGVYCTALNKNGAWGFPCSAWSDDPKVLQKVDEAVEHYKGVMLSGQAR